jgi:hypothetical protein
MEPSDERERERERETRASEEKKIKRERESSFPSREHDVTDMADCAKKKTKKKKTKRKKKRKETHCRTRGGSSFGSIVTFSLSLFSELTRASSDFTLSRERVVRFRVSLLRVRERRKR